MCLVFNLVIYALLLTPRGKTEEEVFQRFTSNPINDTYKYVKPCPGDLVFEEIDGKPFCHILTDIQTYPPRCPYPNYVSIDEVSKIKHKYNNTDIWVECTRSTTHGIDQFRWVDLTDKYGHPNEVYHIDKNILNTTCMVVNNENYYAKNCAEKHHMLCIYSYSYEDVSRYCNFFNVNFTCISMSLDAYTGNCYCKMKSHVGENCGKLAEFRDPFQSHLVATQFPDKQTCRIGLNYSDGEAFWISNNSMSVYTYWSNDTNFSYVKGAMQFHKDAGWVLEENVECSICETQSKRNETVSIQLSFIEDEEEDNYLLLTITNPEFLLDSTEQSYRIFCFTDSNHDDLQKTILTRIESSQKRILPTRIPVAPFPSYYWCEGFRFPDRKVVKSEKILTSKGRNYFNQYAIGVLVGYQNVSDPIRHNYHTLASKLISDALNTTISVISSRPSKILTIQEQELQMYMIVHLVTGFSDITREEEALILNEKLLNLTLDNEVISNITFVKNTEVCYRSRLDLGNYTLNWPETTIGTATRPIEFCVDSDLVPVTRACGGDYYFGARWSEVSGTCSEGLTDSDIAEGLYELLTNPNLTSIEITQNLTQLTQYHGNGSAGEIFLISEILNKVSAKSDELNLEEVVRVVSNVMEYGAHVLDESQKQFNSTDSILSVFDDLLSAARLRGQIETYFLAQASNLLVQISDPTITNVTGIALYRKKQNDSFEEFVTEPLFHNASLKYLLERDDVISASFIPLPVYEEIVNKTGGNGSALTVFAIFDNDRLFNDIVVKENETAYSRIISAFVTGFKGEVGYPIPMVFKLFDNVDNDKVCTHWKYGFDEENILGSWSHDGLPQNESQGQFYQVCEYNHMTHFGLLVMGPLGGQNPDLGVHGTVLDVITAIGVGLSLLGIAAILFTAIAFKKWREDSSNIILVNISLAIGGQICLLFAADNVAEDGLLCSLLGAFLHYFVLAEFCWMFIVAVLQYRKFVMVFYNQTRHLAAKACLIGWGLPLLPIITLVSISVNSYGHNQYGLCYPLDEYITYSVLLPVSIVVIANLTIFLFILGNVCCRKIEAYGQNQHDLRLELLLAILLFFLLGLSWVFGLVVAFGGGIVFSYLFSITATMQGFVMFLFFIVINEASKSIWFNLKKFFCCLDEPRKPKQASATEVSTISREDRSKEK